MLLISRFENYLKMCGFEMGCDTKWKKSQIEKSQNPAKGLVRRNFRPPNIGENDRNRTCLVKFGY